MALDLDRVFRLRVETATQRLERLDDYKRADQDHAARRKPPGIHAFGFGEDPLEEMRQIAADPDMSVLMDAVLCDDEQRAWQMIADEMERQHGADSQEAVFGTAVAICKLTRLRRELQMLKDAHE